MRTPEDLLDAVPHLLGFVPRSSVVVVGLDARARVGPVLRADLPPQRQEPVLAGELLARLTGLGVVSVLLVVYDTAPVPGLPGGTEGSPLLPHVGLQRGLLQAAGDGGVELREALYTDGRRWWSYFCHAGCCPPRGRAVPDPQRPSALAAELLLDNGRPLPSREDVVASIGAVPDPELAAALPAAVRRHHGRSREVRLREGLAVVDGALTDLAAGRRPPAGALAELVALSLDNHVRDGLAMPLLGNQDRLHAAIHLWTELTRRCPAEQVADVAAVLSMCAWSGGHGVLAAAAATRALDADPGHVLAGYLDRLLGAGVAPPGWLLRRASST